MKKRFPSERYMKRFAERSFKFYPEDPYKSWRMMNARVTTGQDSETYERFMAYHGFHKPPHPSTLK